MDLEAPLIEDDRPKSRSSSFAEMGTNTGHVMTLANSIIGVSVLAMPFCFKQCGIILGTLMLILSSIMTRLACYYLIKSAVLARRRNFEFLAFHIFGPTGKLTVELSIIGFMLGTCVAFFVVVGDLGPAILGPIFGVENPQTIRAPVLVGIAVFVVLPLGLLRNVDSLATISAATIAFYICLVLKVMGEATTHLVAWDWLDHVYLWRPAGLLQCIPIFSMALSCQTQLFEIFESIPNGTLDKMTDIVRSAVNLCTLMYVSMGCFGYIAFCTLPFSGNLMLSFSPTPTSEVIKMGFVLSVAVSFPLVIFPCRASLHSLLFRRGNPPHYELLSVSNHMPEMRFKCITLVIVAVSLVTGLLIPNIELVLGLVGSTIGVLVCVIIPATLFLCLTTKNNNERLLAQVLFVVGLMIMVLGSYANLYATEQAISNNEAAPQPPLVPAKPPELPSLNVLPQESKPQVQIQDETLKEIKNVKQLAAALPNLKKEKPVPPLQKAGEKVNLRKKTPAPEAPVLKVEEKADVRKEPPVPEAPVVKVVSENSPDVKVKEITVSKAEEYKKIEPPAVVEQIPPKKEESIHNTIKKENAIVDGAIKKEEAIHHDAIKKEDDEIKEVQKQEIVKKKEELIVKLEENEEKQKKLLEEQKKILQDIKLEKEKLVEENKKLQNIEKKKDDTKVNRGYDQNQEVLDRKKEVPVVKTLPDIPIVKNNLDSVVSPIIKKVEVEQKSLDIIKDDVVKKNMAEGVPLPIVQQLGPHIDAGKSVKIVDNNLANPNEGNPDSKVLRREILGKNEVREQREKRDVQDVELKVQNKAENAVERYQGTSKLVLENKHDKVKQVIEVDIMPGQIQSGNVPMEDGKRKDLPIKDTAKLIEQGNYKLPNELKENEEECPDKNKQVMKFVDELKPLGINEVENKNNLVKSIPESKISNGNKEENHAQSEIGVNQEPTESIIKSPAYLSNPNLVLPAEKLGNSDLENNLVNNAAKLMTRDLKSLDMTQNQNAKERET